MRDSCGRFPVEDENPDYDDLDDDLPEEDDEEDETGCLPCPHCLAPVFEDAERCPECGSYLSREDRPSRRPTWMVVGAGLALAVVVLGWILRVA